MEGTVAEQTYGKVGKKGGEGARTGVGEGGGGAVWRAVFLNDRVGELTDHNLGADL